MTITLPLKPREEAELIAVARAKGISPDALVREALRGVLAEFQPLRDAPVLEARPIWEAIQDNMKDVSPEELAKLPRDGASEHDHYLYGHPKRDQ